MSFISAGNTTTTTLLINGDTTGNLVFNTGGANTTALTISNTQNATFANTVTATGGIIVGASAAPAFIVYQANQQTGIGSTSPTLINYDTKLYDTNNNFSTATSRFTPTVAGYYFVSFGIQIPYAATTAWVMPTLRKNNSDICNGTASQGQNGALYPQASGSYLVYLNGSGDYLTVVAYGTNGSSTYSTSPGQSAVYFAGFLARSA